MKKIFFITLIFIVIFNKSSFSQNDSFEKNTSYSGILLSRFVEQLKIGGDMLFLYEYLDSNHEFKGKIELGVIGKMSKNLKFGFGVATGDMSNPPELEQNLGDMFRQLSFNLDKFYINYIDSLFDEFLGLNITIGKFPHKFLSTGMLWSEELKPTGITEKISFPSFWLIDEISITGIQYIVAQSYKKDIDNSYIIGIQFSIFSIPIEDSFFDQIAVGIGYYNLMDPDTLADQINDLKSNVRNTNRMIPVSSNQTQEFIPNRFTSNFNVLDAILGLKGKIAEVLPFNLKFDFATNFGSTNKDSGIWIEIEIGEITKPEDFQISGIFTWQQQDVTLSMFNSHLIEGTNLLGYGIIATYELFDYTDIFTDLIITQPFEQNTTHLKLRLGTSIRF